MSGGRRGKTDFLAGKKRENEMKIQLIFQMEKIAGPIFAIYIIFFEKFLAIFFRMYYYYKYKVVESGGKWGPVGRY